MKILGIPYEVNIKEPFDRSELNHGSTDFLNTEINICKNLNSESRNSTFLHEVLHVIDFNLGLDLTENQIAAISSGIFSVFTENGFDTKWLKETKK